MEEEWHRSAVACLHGGPGLWDYLASCGGDRTLAEEREWRLLNGALTPRGRLLCTAVTGPAYAR
jgi:hypothetical protein